MRSDAVVEVLRSADEKTDVVVLVEGSPGRRQGGDKGLKGEKIDGPKACWVGNRRPKGERPKGLKDE